MLARRSVKNSDKLTLNPNAKARDGYSVLLSNLILGNIKTANALVEAGANVDVKEFALFCSPDTAKLLENLILSQQKRLSREKEIAIQSLAKHWFEKFMPILADQLKNQKIKDWAVKCKDILFALLARLSPYINGINRTFINSLSKELGLDWITLALIKNPFLNVGSKGTVEQHQQMLNAIKTNDLDKMVYLIAAGACPNAVDFHLSVPGYEKLVTFESEIHKAAELGNRHALLLLLSLEQWNDLNDQGMTPYDVAAFHGQLEIMKVLQNKGASPVKKNHVSGVFPIFCAVAGGNFLSVAYLLENGARVNDRENCYYKTPLHMACNANANQDVIAKLLDQGANVNAKDINGETPLYAAICHKDIKTVKQLLQHGGGN